MEDIKTAWENLKSVFKTPSGKIMLALFAGLLILVIGIFRINIFKFVPKVFGGAKRRYTRTRTVVRNRYVKARARFRRRR